MPHSSEERERFAGTLRALATAARPRADRARAICDAIRQLGGYRWVGIYDVGAEEIAVVGWAGPAAPVHARFPVTQGLTGAVVASGQTVVVGDVSKDARYLSTLGSTRSEMVVPVRKRDRIIGTIDVESEIRNRFSAADRELVEDCAGAIVELWSR